MSTVTAQKHAHLDVIPAKAALGAEVRGVDLSKIDDATFRQLHDIWLDHLLLVFRGQKFSAQDLVSLVKRFGTPVTSSNLHKRSLEERTANKCPWFCSKVFRASVSALC